MAGDLRAQPIWSLRDGVGTLAYGPFTGSVEVANPAFGLRFNAHDAMQLDCTLLRACRSPESLPAGDALSRDDSTQWPLAVADSYVRGADLIASYLPMERWPYAPQLYWRAGTMDVVDGVKASVSLLVSVQTQLLETHPRITVASQAPAKSVVTLVAFDNGELEIEPPVENGWRAPGVSAFCIVRRLDTAPLSLIEFAAASDYLTVRSASDSQGNATSEWQLFAEFLEKGVIRRAQINAAFVSHENDVEIAAECCRALAKAPLPLTA